jgi:hypothetical protein
MYVRLPLFCVKSATRALERNYEQLEKATVVPKQTCWSILQKSDSMLLMFIRTKPVANSSRKRVQICSSHRVGDKVKQKVVRHVGIADNDSHLEELRKLAEVLLKKLKKEQTGPTLFDLLEFDDKQPVTAEQASLQQAALTSQPKTEPSVSFVPIESMKEERRVVDGFHEIFGTLFNQLGFNSILKGKQKDLLRDVILARIAHPASKLATQQILAADFGREVELDRIYRMMDALWPIEP